MSIINLSKVTFIGFDFEVCAGRIQYDPDSNSPYVNWRYCDLFENYLEARDAFIKVKAFPVVEFISNVHYEDSENEYKIATNLITGEVKKYVMKKVGELDYWDEMVDQLVAA